MDLKDPLWFLFEAEHRPTSFRVGSRPSNGMPWNVKFETQRQEYPRSIVPDCRLGMTLLKACMIVSYNMDII